MEEDRIISDDGENTIGRNIRRLRKTQKIRQTEMVARLQVYHIRITREAFVKIERGQQHIKLSQLRGIRRALGVSYEDILDQPREETMREAEKRGRETELRREEIRKKKRRSRRMAAAGKKEDPGPQ